MTYCVLGTLHKLVAVQRHENSQSACGYGPIIFWLILVVDYQCVAYIGMIMLTHVLLAFGALWCADVHACAWEEDHVEYRA